jgi:hypothetical protein
MRLACQDEQHVCIFLPAQGGRGLEVIHPLLRPSYFQLLLSGGGAAPAKGRRREAQLLPTNNQDLSLLERDRDYKKLVYIAYLAKINCNTLNFMYHSSRINI